MKRYHLTCTQTFYGQKDVKTYYNVLQSDVLEKCRFMVNFFNVEYVFIYISGKIGSNAYIACYSRKYDNFRAIDGRLHKTYF